MSEQDKQLTPEEIRELIRNLTPEQLRELVLQYSEYFSRIESIVAELREIARKLEGLGEQDEQHH